MVSKRTLLAEVWQQAYGGGDRTVDVRDRSERIASDAAAAAERVVV